MMKKLILAIVHSDAVEAVNRVLIEARYAVTQISSMGVFLRRGSTTMVVGIDEGEVEKALDLIRQACQPYSKGNEHAATIFVMNASQFFQT